MDDALKSRRQGKSVRLPLGREDGRLALGVEVEGAGNSYRLDDSFESGVRKLGGDRCNTIFLRTESGNLYRLFRSLSGAELVNAKTGKKYDIDLGEQRLAGSVIEIGRPFGYAHRDASGELKHGITTPVTLIVATNEGSYSSDFISAPNAQSDIWMEFNNMLMGSAYRKA